MSSVWADPETRQDYLLVMDQCLWFGSLLKHSLMNPNQLREYGHYIYDDPYQDDMCGIETETAFIPFDTTGTIVHFSSRAPTVRVSLLTGETWNPTIVEMRRRGNTRE
jgi:hypothetical protein